ncbi:MAG: DNA polymerase III subunit delta [Patescibacteria group bacterium]
MAGNIFLFFGADTYSMNEKISFWKSEFIKKHGGDINLDEMDGAVVVSGSLVSILTAVPFLGEKRLVIVRDYMAKYKTRGDENDQKKNPALEDQKKTAELIEKIPEFCIVVFAERSVPDKRSSLYKRLQKHGTLMEFNPLEGSKLLAWIQRETKKLGVEIEQKAALTLMDLVGGDLFRMGNEIRKLASFADYRAINENDIDLLVDTTLDTSIFKLTDALALKNARQCLGILEQLIESGEDPHMILFMIIRQFRLMIQIKDFASHRVSQNEMISKLGVHPFVVKSTLNQCNAFSFEKLSEMYAHLLDIETKMKTGKIKTLVGDQRELTLALDRLVLKACGK